MIINSFKKFNNITDYYQYYIKNKLGNRSYSSIYNIVRKEKVLTNYIILGNIKSNNSFSVQYYAYDYISNQLLYLVDKYGDSFSNYLDILKFLAINYGIPNNIYCYGNSFLKHKKSIKYLLFLNICSKYNINIITDYNHKLSMNIKKIEKEISSNKLILSNNKITSTNNIKTIINHAIINTATRKVLNDNTIEYDNIIYKIVNNKTLCNSKATLCFYDDTIYPEVKVNNMLYSTIVLKKKESKKKY